jgi:hypothetical protein
MGIPILGPVSLYAPRRHSPGAAGLFAVVASHGLRRPASDGDAHTIAAVMLQILSEDEGSPHQLLFVTQLALDTLPYVNVG